MNKLLPRRPPDYPEPDQCRKSAEELYNAHTITAHDECREESGLGLARSLGWWRWHFISSLVVTMLMQNYKSALKETRDLMFMLCKKSSFVNCRSRYWQVL